MDGLDCGLFNITLTDPDDLRWECLDFKTIPYNEKVRENIRAALDGDHVRWKVADLLLGQVFAVYSKEFLKNRVIDLIGCHGQTIAHEDGVLSIQAGNPRFLAEELNVPVIYDFRSADIIAGGNGAPLMPFLDWLLFKNAQDNLLTLNLGGIANITVIPKEGDRGKIIGFDTGPGMALIDECARLYFRQICDRNGDISSAGNINPELLDALMQHPFVQKNPPKSTGRHEFSSEMVRSLKEKYPHISNENLLRTLVLFTAKSISYNVGKYVNFDISKSKLIVSGGGVFHPGLMNDLRQYVNTDQIITSIEVGIDPNMKESLLMAVLAVARIKKIHSNMPKVTGASESVCLGKIHKGNR